MSQRHVHTKLNIVYLLVVSRGTLESIFTKILVLLLSATLATILKDATGLKL
jgi:hypothetical protein